MRTAPVDCTTGTGPFRDLSARSNAYRAVMALVGRHALKGYADCTFRPGSALTRGEAVRAVVTAFRLRLIYPARGHFRDVHRSSALYPYVETAFALHLFAPYRDGTASPGAAVSRGDLTQLLVAARGWRLVIPHIPTFADVPMSSALYGYVETGYVHGVLDGFACGGRQELCDRAQRRYYRPGSEVNRAEGASLIVATYQTLTARATPVSLTVWLPHAAVRGNSAVTIVVRAHPRAYVDVTLSLGAGGSAQYRSHDDGVAGESGTLALSIRLHVATATALHARLTVTASDDSGTRATYRGTVTIKPAGK